MVSNDVYVEELLYKDAAKIIIDDEFKYDLKNRIISGAKYSNNWQRVKELLLMKL